MMDMIHLLKYGSLGFALIFGFATIFLVLKRNRDTDKKEKEIQDFVRKSITANKKVYFRDYIQNWLIRKGMGFEYKGKIGVELFILISFFLGIFGGIIAFKISVKAVPLGIIVGLILFPYLIYDSDKRDNVRMLPDIERIFSTIYIQNQAGVYLPTTIISCSKAIKHDRLRCAFDKLSAAIIANKDIDVALYSFEKNFDNIYLSSLVIIIQQALTTGQAGSMLKDTVSLIDGINETLNMKCENKTSNNIMGCSILFYGALLLILGYLMIVGMKNSLTGL